MGMTIEEFEEYAKSHNILLMTREFYETRLKADMVAMLTDLQLEIEELYPEHQCSGELTGFADAIETITPLIQQKIDALGGNEK